MKPHNLFNSFREFEAGPGRRASFYSLPALEEAGLGPIRRLPVSLRIVLEAVLRNCDGKKVNEANVRALAAWAPKTARTEEIPFVVARIVLQDFTGVPLLVDLAAMRSAAQKLGKNPRVIEPLVPVDLVVDHSVQVDFARSPQAMQLNLEMEFRRNRERYEFLKWGQQAFETFKVVPPGIGIVHQVNLEYLASGVLSTNLEDGRRLVFPDTLVGTDSHTTMINGLGIVGWGVGGIEAEAGMLGQPVYFLTPDVVGVHLTGTLKTGVTATDLVLHVTEMLRAQKVVGKFVEFYGPGAAALSVPDRATIGNMAPEYGATMGFFPVDAQTITYLRQTGRSEETCHQFENYFKAQQMFGMPQRGQIDYSVDLELDLSIVQPGLAGPKRPQDRINLPDVKQRFRELLRKSPAEGGYGKSPEQIAQHAHIHLHGELASGSNKFTSTDTQRQIAPGEPRNQLEMVANRPTPDQVSELPLGPQIMGEGELANGSVIVAAITSCTNTSNPSVMLAAGLLAKKAVERGLTVGPLVKTSLAPGSRVVTEYLSKAGLQPYLDELGFNVVGYGCTTCIGNSGPLQLEIEEALVKLDLVAAAVLSGNRNFEARIHQNVKANFLMSPPLVVAFAIAGRVDIDLTREALGRDNTGQEVFLRELWPTMEEIGATMQLALNPEVYRRLYADFASQNPKWNEIPSSTGHVYEWNTASDYIQEPPFFTDFTMTPGGVVPVRNARPLGIFGDSVTTDHISPAGSIKPSSPAGKYLLSRGVKAEDFNSYGSRRGNDRVMTRGTFANVRIKNLMVPGIEGGVTKHYPSGEVVSIFEAAMKYQGDNVPLVILAGHEYGTGSSRDWAAKGTRLLGVKAVIAASFERIHRSNLLGMGVLPLQFQDGTTPQTLHLDGRETFDLSGLEQPIRPQQDCTLRIHRPDGKEESVTVRCRIDTPIEVEYYQHGGILPFVLRQLLR